MERVTEQRVRNGYRLLLFSRVVGVLAPLPGWLLIYREIGWWWPAVLAWAVFTAYVWWLTLMALPARYIDFDEADGIMTLGAPFRAVPIRLALSDVGLLYIHPQGVEGVTRAGLKLKSRKGLMHGYDVYVPDAVVENLESVLPTIAPLRKWRDMPGQWFSGPR